MSDAEDVNDAGEHWLVDTHNDPYDPSITVTITVKLVGDEVDYHITSRGVDREALIDLLGDAAEIVAEGLEDEDDY